MSYFPPRDEYGLSDYIREHPQRYIDRARFYGHYRNDPDRLRVLIDADELKTARCLEEWQFLTENYPSFTIEADALTKEDNEDVPVRAHYLRNAVGRLLEVVNAPSNMIADVDRFFAEFRPRQAKLYGDAQAALLRDEAASITEVAKSSGLDRSTIHKLLKAGVLVRP